MDVETIVKHKFVESANMTFQEVFNFAFKTFIPVLHNLASELGEEQVREALKRIAFESGFKAGQDTARWLPCNDFAAFTASLRDCNHFWKHVLTFDIVEDTAQAFAVNVTECLWAKTFREMGEADIGYLLICHPDYASCQGFNPKITMTRSATLMQGDPCCNHRWIWGD